jgi:hypothetical protein
MRKQSRGCCPSVAGRGYCRSNAAAGDVGEADTDFDLIDAVAVGRTVAVVFDLAAHASDGLDLALDFHLGLAHVLDLGHVAAAVCEHVALPGADADGDVLEIVVAGNVDPVVAVEISVAVVAVGVVDVVVVVVVAVVVVGIVAPVVVGTVVVAVAAAVAVVFVVASAGSGIGFAGNDKRRDCRNCYED